MSCHVHSGAELKDFSQVWKWEEIQKHVLFWLHIIFALFKLCELWNIFLGYFSVFDKTAWYFYRRLSYCNNLCKNHSNKILLKRPSWSFISLLSQCNLSSVCLGLEVSDRCCIMPSVWDTTAQSPKYTTGHCVLSEYMQELFPVWCAVWPWLLRTWAQLLPSHACLKFSPEMTPSCSPLLPSFKNSWDSWAWRSYTGFQSCF